MKCQIENLKRNNSGINKINTMNRIRIHLILFSLLMAGIACYSQSPNLISYQTVIRNGNNEFVSNTTIGVRISILGGPEANVLVYQEEHTVKTNINGLAYLTIGNGKILNGLITSIDWSKGPYFIKSETDPTGGKNYSIVVLSQMLSVPYAIYSSTAEKLTGPLPEKDPLFNGSIAKGITAIDTSYWNKKLNSSDTSRMLSNYLTSINNKMDAKDTTKMLSNYLKKSESLNEVDPIFSGSIANGITTKDTSYWNKKLNTTDTIGMLEDYLKKESFPKNPENGDILFYFGNKWVNLAKGKNGQVLTLIEGVPKWSGAVFPTLTTIPISYITSTNARTGGNISADGSTTNTSRGVVWSTNPGPTITLTTKTSNGTGTGSFSTIITNLTPKTTYYVRAFATYSSGTDYGNEITFTTLDSSNVMGVTCPGTPTVKDIDGNIYNTVQIGTQCWTKENLRVTKYKDGTSIPTGLNNASWSDTNSGAYIKSNNDDNSDLISGKLYNWYSVADNRGLCPNGWHVPSNDELTTLINYLGGDFAAGGKMKATGTTYWFSPNGEATNESGFTALPAGERQFNGGLIGSGLAAGFWSANEFRFRTLTYAHGWSLLGNGEKTLGLSVRCLRD